MRWRWTLLPVALLAVTPSPAGAAGGGGCHEVTEGVAEGATATVELVDVCFTPGVLRVDEGTTVTFVNRDQMVHNVAGVGWGWGDVEPGGRFSQQFAAAGTYAYSCYLHVSMTGVVVVGDGVGSGPVVPVTAVEAEPIAAAVPERAPAPAARPAGAAGSDDGGGVSSGLAVAGAAGALVVGFGARDLAARRARR